MQRVSIRGGGAQCQADSREDLRALRPQCAHGLPNRAGIFSGHCAGHVAGQARGTGRVTAVGRGTKDRMHGLTTPHVGRIAGRRDKASLTPFGSHLEANSKPPPSQSLLHHGGAVAPF
jgi:hypothetical protein